MKWIIQRGLYNAEGFDKLISALDTGKIDYEVVTVVPFSDQLIPEPTLKDDKVFAFGAYTMCEIAKSRGWNPGVFLNENFDYRELVNKLGTEVLNSDAEFLPFADVKIKERAFIRPVLDTKTFAGRIYEPEEFQQWQKNTMDVSGGGFTTLTPDVVVLVAKPKPVYLEYRFFIVDGKISAASAYAFLGNLNSNFGLPESAISYVRRIMAEYNPARAFVLDVAMLDNTVDTNRFKYKIVEINCINGAAFYNADVSKLVQDLDFLLKKYD